MIIMDIQIDNFYAFKNFHMNMSYPKKIVNSYIKNEYLHDRPNFRYKKVNILMGSNATGKTSFGKILMNIFNFIDKRTSSNLIKQINNINKPASFSMDFIVEKNILYRLECKINSPKESNNYVPSDIDLFVKSVDIFPRDNYETCARRLDLIKRSDKSDYISELEKIEELHWYFEYPADANPEGILLMPTESSKFILVLEHVLKALDPSIQKVEKSKDSDNAYVVRMKDKSVIIQNNEKFTTELLSSGTKTGISVACVIDRMIENSNSFYYCDEKFSFIHSDIEKAVLALLINSITPNDQFFFTTHNTDILDMPLPKHSFTFLRKNIDDEEFPIECINASDLLKRNTDSLRNAVENDLFSTAPATDLIYDIENLF